MNFFKNVLRRFQKVEQNVVNRGSAFAKLAVHEAEHLEAKGKILALDAALTAAKYANEGLLAEAARVHAAYDKMAEERQKIIALF
jgi:arginine utilization protein RocB